MANIKLMFRGDTYTIPEDRAFEAGEAVEEIVTLAELAGWGRKPKFHKLSRCFGELLRFAGCKVSDREVHAEMMAQMKRDPTSQDSVALSAINALVAILMDGAPEADGDEPAGKKNAS